MLDGRLLLQIAFRPPDGHSTPPGGFRSWLHRHSVANVVRAGRKVYRLEPVLDSGGRGARAWIAWEAAAEPV
jgi:hypothetical protein